MRKSAAVLTFVLLLVSFRADAAARRRAAITPAPPVPVDSTYLDVALKAAAWLESVEKKSGETSSWPWDMKNARFALPGLPGTSGVGTFYLRLYQSTRDPRHLQKANAAAASVGAHTFTPEMFDWQGGAVGAGSFLMTLYRETRDPLQLRRAETIANALLAQGVRDGDGMYWIAPSAPTKLFTGMAHGAAGVGMFLLQVHEHAPNAAYVEGAEAAARWAARHTVPLRSGIGWKRLTTDTEAYHGWCGGSAGIVFFLGKLWQVTGKEEYRALLTSTADGLLSAAVKQPRGVNWKQTTSANSASTLAYCHGTTSVIGALAHAYALTSDVRYLDAAVAGTDYLETVSENHDGARSWPSVSGGNVRYFSFMLGTASIGHTMLRLYRHHPEARVMALAKDAAAFLIRTAEAPAAGQARWPVLAEPVPAANAADQTYTTGWYEGTAGIGMYFLELHEFASGRIAPADFSPANP